MANTIGDLLVHEGLISAAQLAQALSCQKRNPLTASLPRDLMEQLWIAPTS